ncbi:CoA transferase [Nocardioides sp. YIM 152588]|uniref:CoA transferase n=1 Tax=Nocardioides sp. YIM 152588 TaxID=3158259 RepID=UPI0032E3C833
MRRVTDADADADAVAAWAASGAMALTGRADGPPRVAPGAPALRVREALAAVARSTEARTGRAPRLPGVGLLGERASIAGLGRRGPWSCGGSFRAFPAADGWFGISLPRDDDLSLVPALVEADPAGDPWAAVAAWARDRSAAEAEERAALLGLAGAAAPPDLGGHAGTRPGVVSTPGGVRRLPERPLVLDLSSLWAGPLCAHLLGLAGCRVVKVESTGRPDGTRRGPAAFFDLLHGGHDSVALDFGDADERRRLADLVARADLVIEASRPRALAGLGIDAAAHVAAGTTWVSITARGRDSNTIGFGDDVAVAAGLALPDADELLPVGDALADPLTGVAAAAAATAALLGETATLVDVSMLDVARAAAGTVPEAAVHRHDGRWWVESAGGRHPVAGPEHRRPTGPGPVLGADRGRWVR